MDYSLSVGIDDYLYERATPYAENDAAAFHSIMKNIFKVPNSVLLLGNEATYKNIELEIDNITDRLDEDDRFIFFFAGHGINLGDSPFLSTYECKTDSEKIIRKTFHCVLELIDKINDTGCKKSLFFIDACESTIQLGSRNSRVRKFSFEEIEEMLEENTYSCVFSSCSHKGVADVYPEKRHGIWSYYLLQALSGSEPKAFSENNCLTNKSLANYLNISVRTYCKANPRCDIQQTHTWGKEEGEFLIFKFPKAVIQKYKEIPQSTLKRVEFITINFEGVKKLKGFVKNKHTEPRFYSSAVDRFINDIASADINEHMESVAKSLKELLGLKKKEFTVSYYGDSAIFECLYFTYSYSVAINKDDLDTVTFTASLLPHKIDKLLEVPNIDECFPNWFDFLLFSLEKSINVEKLIEKIEDADEEILKDYKYEYDSQCTYIELENKKLGRVIIIKEREIRIQFNYKEEIIDMLDGLREVANQMKLVSPEYKLLG